MLASFYKIRINARLFPLFIISLLFIHGCKYKGENESETNLPQSINSSIVNKSVVINQEGLRLYGEQCASCHGNSGSGTAIGSSLIACPTCNDQDVLSKRIETTMPINSIGTCDNECANNIADYILVVFNGKGLTVTNHTLQQVKFMPPKKTLYKSSLSLIGRLPTTDELQRVSNDGEVGLSRILDHFLNDEKFLNRVKEIYNDQLLTDKYLGSENALALLDSRDFPNRRWYRDIGLDLDDQEQRKKYYELRTQTNDAVAREILELIAHVVRNNRPFTEILTADYMMVNAFSAKVYDVESQVTTNIDDIAYGQGAPFKEARIANYPHAGILTSAMFLNRFPTTRTNRNRHRSKTVYDFFLDTDILSIAGSRPTKSDDIATNNPILNNPNCVVCH
ncbi:MAG: DUF1592 domain-containing protein [Methylococcales bacterium]|jgi:hypothetical protein|nr:DUF1592 domain-containing protein [Methylococcales bacterium]MBT7410417.1 DUF1592 domain-containing protein [Methylococcales bacterium]